MGNLVISGAVYRIETFVFANSANLVGFSCLGSMKVFPASVWRVQYLPRLVQRYRSEEFDQIGNYKSDNYLGTIGCGHFRLSLVLALDMDECNETTMGCPNSE